MQTSGHIGFSLIHDQLIDMDVTNAVILVPVGTLARLGIGDPRQMIVSPETGNVMFICESADELPSSVGEFTTCVDTSNLRKG